MKELNSKDSKLYSLASPSCTYTLFCEHWHYISEAKLWNGKRGLRLRFLRIASQQFQCFEGE